MKGKAPAKGKQPAKVADDDDLDAIDVVEILDPIGPSDAKKLSPAKSSAHGNPKRDAESPVKKRTTDFFKRPKKGAEKAEDPVLARNVSMDDEKLPAPEAVPEIPTSVPVPEALPKISAEHDLEAAPEEDGEEEAPVTTGKKRGRPAGPKGKKAPPKKAKVSKKEEKEEEEENEAEAAAEEPTESKEKEKEKEPEKEKEKEPEKEKAKVKAPEPSKPEAKVKAKVKDEQGADSEEEEEEEEKDEDYGSKPKGRKTLWQTSAKMAAAAAPATSRKTKNSGSTGAVTPNFASLTKTLPTSSPPKAGLSRGKLTKTITINEMVQ